MAVGYSAAGACWATTQEAIDAFYSAQNVTSHLVTTGTYNIFYKHKFVNISGVWNDALENCSLGAFNNVQKCATIYKPAPSNVIGSCTLPVASTSTPVEFGLPAGFDYTILGAIFAFSFSIVVGLWLFGRSAGSIVNIFKPK